MPVPYLAATISTGPRWASCASPQSRCEVRQPAGPGYTLERAHRVVGWLALPRAARSAGRRDGLDRHLARRRPGAAGALRRPLSEIFVPYMSPQKDWYVRNFIDAGEFSAGGLAEPLRPGVDCPAYATYIDSVVRGRRLAEGQAARGLHVRAHGGDMIWRHSDEGRPQRELVVRIVAVLGNYDYVFDWGFLPDGTDQGRHRRHRHRRDQDDDREGRATWRSTNGPKCEAADAYGRFVERPRRGHQPRSLLQFPPRHGRRRTDQPVRPGCDRWCQDAAARSPAPQHLGARDQAGRRRAGGAADMDMHAPALWRVTSQAGATTSATRRVIS